MINLCYSSMVNKLWKTHHNFMDCFMDHPLMFNKVFLLLSLHDVLLSTKYNLLCFSGPFIPVLGTWIFHNYFITKYFFSNEFCSMWLAAPFLTSLNNEHPIRDGNKRIMWINVLRISIQNYYFVGSAFTVWLKHQFWICSPGSCFGTVSPLH